MVVLVTDEADADDNYDTSEDDRITVTVNVAGGGNNAPAFPAGAVSFSIDENITTVVSVGTPVIAEDDDTDDTLTYTLEGTDAGFFTIGNTDGQIKTKANQSYDFETKPTYSVTVKADDSNGGTATKGRDHLPDQHRRGGDGHPVAYSAGGPFGCDRHLERPRRQYFQHVMAVAEVQ